MEPEGKEHLPAATEQVEVSDAVRAEHDVPFTGIDHLPGAPDAEREPGTGS